MFSRHLEFLKHRKVGERMKFLPRWWATGERNEGEGGKKSTTPSPPTLNQIRRFGERSGAQKCNSRSLIRCLHCRLGCHASLHITHSYLQSPRGWWSWSCGYAYSREHCSMASHSLDPYGATHGLDLFCMWPGTATLIYTM